MRIGPVTNLSRFIDMLEYNSRKAMTILFLRTVVDDDEASSLLFSRSSSLNMDEE